MASLEDKSIWEDGQVNSMRTGYLFCWITMYLPLKLEDILVMSRITGSRIFDVKLFE